jgi:hypothetical protein
MFTEDHPQNGRSSLKEWGLSRGLVAVFWSSPLGCGRAKKGVGVKARAQPDREAAAGPWGRRRLAHDVDGGEGSLAWLPVSRGVGGLALIKAGHPAGGQGGEAAGHPFAAAGGRAA